MDEPFCSVVIFLFVVVIVFDELVGYFSPFQGSRPPLHIITSSLCDLRSNILLPRVRYGVQS